MKFAPFCDIIASVNKICRKPETFN